MSGHEATADDGLATFLARYEGAARAAAENFGTMLGSVDRLGEAADQFVAWATTGRPASHGFIIIIAFFALVAVGALAEWLYRRAVRPSGRGSEAPVEDSLAARLRIGLSQFVRQAVGIVIFQAAALATYFLLNQGHLQARQIILAYLTALVIVRLLAAVSTLLLAPRTPELRIVPLSDAVSQRIHLQFVAAVSIAAFGYMTAALFRLAGLAPELVSLLLLLPFVVFFGIVLAMVLTLRTGRPRTERWHILAIAYVVFVFVTGLIATQLRQTGVLFSVVGSLLLGVALPLLDAFMRGALRGQSQAGETATPAQATPPAGSARMMNGMRSGTRVMLYAAGAVVFARIWGIDLFALAAQGLGGAVAQAVLKIIFTVVLALVVWELVKAAIDRKLASEAPAQPGEHEGEGGGTGRSRLSTLLPLFRKVLFVAILLIAVMTVLSSLGIDIGPLLAGAGVLGLAIGFGAQTLVKDIVSGVFFLLDDAFRVGEYVEIGNNRGTVEHISIRSLRLRHHRGPLLTVPFGEIKTLTNHSRDWAIVKMQFSLPVGTDPARFKKVVKRVGADLLAHPEYGTQFIEPLKSQGVRGTDQAGILFGVKFMAKPGEQFVLRREAYQRVLAELEKAGIQLALPQVIVQVPTGGTASESQSAALQAGAAAALQARAADEKKSAAE